MSKDDIKTALAAIPSGNLLACARGFFGALGYTSERTIELDDDVDKFITTFATESGMSGTKTENSFREKVQSVHIVFQVTNKEILEASQMNLLDAEGFYQGNTKSFLFVAVRVKPDNYSRGKYAEMTREINKRFPMPTVVLFSNGDKATLAFVSRRESKRGDRPILDKVSLIKDCNCSEPHRAHLDILSELSLDDCLGWIGKIKAK